MREPTTVEEGVAQVVPTMIRKCLARLRAAAEDDSYEAACGEAAYNLDFLLDWLTDDEDDRVASISDRPLGRTNRRLGRAPITCRH